MFEFLKDMFEFLKDMFEILKDMFECRRCNVLRQHLSMEKRTVCVHIIIKVVFEYVIILVIVQKITVLSSNKELSTSKTVLACKSSQQSVLPLVSLECFFSMCLKVWTPPSVVAE